LDLVTGELCTPADSPYDIRGEKCKGDWFEKCPEDTKSARVLLQEFKEEEKKEMDERAKSFEKYQELEKKVTEAREAVAEQETPVETKNDIEPQKTNQSFSAKIKYWFEKW
jgi:hypothetical protein